MDKHLLLTVSDGPSASYTLRFVRDMLSNFCDTRMTLVYVAPRAMDWRVDNPGMEPTDAVAEKIEAIKITKGAATLNKAKQWLMDVAGCDGKNVDTKVIHSRRGVVREIIDEARNGLYDAAVFGSRAYTWFETMFEDSVAHEILWKDIDFPIWITRRPSDFFRTDVLLCVDGSAPSLRMADHVGFMLNDQPEHKVVLFHAAEHSLTGDGQVNDMLMAAQQKLLDNGFPEERIEYKVVRSNNVAKAVMEENTKGQYAAIALGKRGNRKAPLESIFPSSLSIKLLRLNEDAALWISK